MLYFGLHPCYKVEGTNNSAFPYTKLAVTLLWFLKKKLGSRVLDLKSFGNLESKVITKSMNCPTLLITFLTCVWFANFGVWPKNIINHKQVHLLASNWINNICKILNGPTLNKAKQVNSSHIRNIRKGNTTFVPKIWS
jgi:hypothetical protein